MVAAILKEKFSHLFPQKQLFFTGSGTSALFLYLKATSISGKQILCPSNICYSVVFAIMESGNVPLFCDVDPYSGNITLTDLQQVIDQHHDIGAAVLPYMYANAIEDLPLIVQHCKEKGIRVVEDLAAALGTEYREYQPGTLGDAAIYSFGRNKHIDLGNGGLLGINTMGEFSIEILRPFHERASLVQQRFERAYKKVLYSTSHLERLESLQDLARNSASSYIGGFLPDTDYVKLLEKRLHEAMSEKKRRCELVSYIDANIIFASRLIQPYAFADGSNIWRYNLLVSDKGFKDKLINKLLEAKMPVSIWYPPINKLFSKEFPPKVIEFSRKIVNLDFSKMDRTAIATFIALVNRQVRATH
ncbi:MAG: DegT/DnrJ/EryC1/StrS family aminotransferase [Proteobacteria bacterium]|nr:DegT/DnrJ/EryC1/StrS family aminotransferase [Pseudomonadota bacterium]